VCAEPVAWLHAHRPAGIEDSGVTANGTALLGAAAGVGFGHAVLPDHWVPLALVARTRRYRLWRVARLSGLAGAAHVLVSVVLGAVIIAVGLQFRSAVQNAQDTIVGSILIATGVAFAALELRGHGHGHPHHESGHHHPHELEPPPHHHGIRRWTAVMVPFGAAASPDLTILPVFLAATPTGTATAVGSLLVFAAVTIGTFVALTVTATRSGYKVRGAWLDRWGNLLTASVLVAIGALVVMHVV
jgi:hypothetical protein